jgi:hypothetical protein
MTIFYDSTVPGNIPEGTFACLYYDGRYAASPDEAKRFLDVRWITIGSDFKNAGIVDFEEGNPSYSSQSALREFVEGRKSLGLRARVYTDLDNLPLVRSRLEGLDYLVWLATLNGRKLAPDYTPGLWGVQYQGGPDAAYDMSVLYGTW